MLHYDVHAFFVGYLFHFFGNLLLIVVDAVVGAQLASLLQFMFVTCGNDARMKQLGHLNGGNADARACA